MARRSEALLLVLALAATASAQDHDTYSDDPSRGDLSHHTMDSFHDSPRTPEPVSSYDPSDEAPPPDAMPPAGSPGTKTAPGDKAQKSESSSSGDETQFKLNGRARLELGYDWNVFHARARKTGPFFHGYGEANLLIELPQERELSISLSGEGIDYFHQPTANESDATSFIDYYHPLSSIFDIEVQNRLEYSAENLLDDNGDLYPRGRFNAYDEEGRATLIIHASRSLSFEASGGARYKFFESSPTFPALDYWEARGSAGVRWKPWTDGRFRLRYVFRERQYTELTADTGIPAPTTLSTPKLELQRHQVMAAYSQKVDFLGMRVILQLGYTYTLNIDTFKNDRSYDEHAMSGNLEWWFIPDWTGIIVDVSGGDRIFRSRRTLQRGDPYYGTSLEEAYLDSTVTFTQKIVDHLSVVVEASYHFYHSTEVRLNYDRLVVEAGLEGSF